MQVSNLKTSLALCNGCLEPCEVIYVEDKGVVSKCHKLSIVHRTAFIDFRKWEGE